MLTNTQAAPLGNRPESGRTSLAGVQDKIVLARQDEPGFQVLEEYPSTHIVTPPSVRFPTITFDEECGFRAATAAGLTMLNAWREDFGGFSGLVMDRFDRSPDAPQGRIHQEDMNRAWAPQRTRSCSHSQEARKRWATSTCMARTSAWFDFPAAPPASPRCTTSSRKRTVIVTARWPWPSTENMCKPPSRWTILLPRRSLGACVCRTSGRHCALHEKLPGWTPDRRQPRTRVPAHDRC